MKHAFRANALDSVTIPDSVTTIQTFAFYQNRMSTLTLGASLAEIGTVAFLDNDLTSVTIPASVTSIGRSAFDANRGLTAVIFVGAPPTIVPAGSTASLGTGAELTVYSAPQFDAGARPAAGRCARAGRRAPPQSGLRPPRTPTGGDSEWWPPVVPGNESKPNAKKSGCPHLRRSRAPAPRH